MLTSLSINLLLDNLNLADCPRLDDNSLINESSSKSLINVLIDDLSLPKNIQQFENVESPTSTVVFSICQLLLEKIICYDSSCMLTDTRYDSFDKIFKSEALGLYRPNLPFDAPNFQYHTLHHLITVLQAKRIEFYRRGGQLRRQNAAEKGKVLFTLEKICQDLNLYLPFSSNEREVIQSVIAALKAKEAKNQADKYKKIITAIDLNPTQTQHFQLINQALLQDFSVRRKMMIKRLDVTIQSFLWGEKAIGKEGEIVAAIQAQRQHLQENPTTYTLNDVMKAPIMLLYEHSRKVTDRGSLCKKGSLVKNIIIGRVPDRGGRTHEMRPKANEVGFSDHTSKQYQGHNQGSRIIKNNTTFRNHDDNRSKPNNKFQSAGTELNYIRKSNTSEDTNSPLNMKVSIVNELANAEKMTGAASASSPVTPSYRQYKKLRSEPTDNSTSSGNDKGASNNQTNSGNGKVVAKSGLKITISNSK